MDTVKVINGFYTKCTARIEKYAQVKLAKKAGRVITVDICNAFNLFNNDRFFRSKIEKFGRPAPGQLIVVIYYRDEAGDITQIEEPKHIEMIEEVSKSMPLPVFEYHEYRESEGAARAKAILIALNTRNNTNLIRKKGRTVEFIPSFNLGLIA